MSDLPVLNSSLHQKAKAPIRIMQFGEGNFLRAFIDWMIKKLNDTTSYKGHVVVVQPLPMGRVKELAVQDGLYTVILQGLNEKKEAVKTHEIVDVLDDFVNPYIEFNKFLDYGRSKDLNVIVSNTTEAGIAFDESDVNKDMTKETPNSYPGKLLALLKARYEALGMEGEIAIMPCELIDDNGDHLREVLLALAEARKEDEGFVKFLKESCHYTSSLVDRIVPGFPRDEFQELCQEYGYVDNNMVKGEYFNLLVYRKEAFCEKVFPLHTIGGDVHCIYVDDVHPYKARKVRCLNGAHSSMVPVAYLAGFDEVRECLLNDDVNKFMHEEIFNEIVPTVHVKDVEKFASDVVDRFLNPYVHHKLMSIALNSIPKFKERDLPTILDNYAMHKAYPRHLMFAMAALLKFYEGYRVVNGVKEEIKLADDAKILDTFKTAWAEFRNDNDLVKLTNTLLSDTFFWGQDLTKLEGFEEAIMANLAIMVKEENFKKILADFVR